MISFIDVYNEYLFLKNTIKNIFLMYDNEQKKYFVSIGWSENFYKNYKQIEKII
jgi:ssDNA-specific exonuclease RecJ